MNIIVKNTGMMNSIIFCCRGSPVVGVIFCWTNIVMPMRTGGTYGGSWAARSQIHTSTPYSRPKQRNVAVWRSTDTDIARGGALELRACSANRGTQPIQDAVF